MTIEPKNIRFSHWLITGIILFILLQCFIPAGAAAAAAPTTDAIAIATLPIYKVVLPGLVVDITASPSNINRESFSTITVTVINTSKYPVSGATVTLTKTGGTLQSSSGTTDGSGTFTTKFSSSLSGTFYVNVTASKSGYYSGSDSTSVTVINTPPQAYFSASPLSGQAPLRVEFDASGSNDIDGTIVSYSWDFGDDKSGSGQQLDHNYQNPGTYYPLLTVTDNLGLTHTYQSEIQVSEFPVLAVTLTSDPISVQMGTSSTITVTVTGRNGEPVKDAFVILDPSSEGLSVWSGNTDSNGQFTSSFAGTEAGEVIINTVVSKDDYADGTGTIKLMVNPVTAAETAAETPVPTQTVKVDKGLPWELIIPIIIILLLVLIGLFLWTKSNVRLKPKVSKVPCDGESTLPIEVSFVNAFGKAKKQKKDREVEMETTSGSIENVVIPEGKESAVATLTSSTECGPVTVTGKSGNQVGTANVDFESTGAGLEVDISPGSIQADGKSTATVTVKMKDEKGSYISFHEEKKIELTTTLGTVTTPITVPPKSLAGTGVITSGQVSGTATVAATMEQLKGEATVEFAELPKRYCMHCGAPMAMEAANCPKCQMTPPSGVDTKPCASCNAVLPQTAKFCDKCGAKQPDIQE